jgi:hypothetical protein
VPKDAALTVRLSETCWLAANVTEPVLKDAVRPVEAETDRLTVPEKPPRLIMVTSDEA